MIYRINQLRVNLDYTPQQIQEKIKKITRLQDSDLKNITIIRRSLDARKAPVYSLTVEIETDKSLKANRDIQPFQPKKIESISFRIKNYQGKQPIVVGAGPAGLMAALTLAENGIPPIVLERGEKAADRAATINHYLKTGELNKESNILFGEGGAGLFSDGKLTARSKERRLIKYFFEKLVACGASSDILIDAEPHLGSDVLQKIIPALRTKIIELGGIFHFKTKVESLSINEGKIISINTAGNAFETDCCILAVGHSARDVYQELSRAKVSLSPKSFAVGVRVELPQRLVNESQYGKYTGNPKLGAASFRLTRKPEAGFRSCYTFCMCPGGIVMPCASSAEEITTNGMSLSHRDGKKANAAFLVPVNEQDFTRYFDPEFPELSGLFFQKSLEKKIFKAGGSDYSIPAATLSDFLNHKPGKTIPENSSCKRLFPTVINGILPQFVEETLKHSIPKMLGKIGKPNFDEVAVYCGETRSSSPVRINRDRDSLESVNAGGLYPCGEGAGYAGGIVSSAIDGIKAAEAWLKKINQG